MPIDTTDLWPEPDPGAHPGGAAAGGQSVQAVDADGFVPFDAVPVPSASQAETDQHAADLRDATHQQIAVVLEELALEVEDLGGRLCTDMEIATRHMDVLQAIDLIAQKQRSLAKLLEADCPVKAIEQIGIDVLRDRMRMFH
ncbi:MULTISPECIES: hypothetical protein [unclassified Novosphingobium]|uniref:hypothetical protein n=1 Tax=unclassified Novosphingobium TaxID=2644732 RepID=UPI0017EC3B22|nr:MULTISPECIES: hypothetical protein [unclassified Novosphingobium]NKJ40689.1 hypothetical protein [Novosphingobium sp. SG720]NMN02980.1 hypothetical protein [Novosphingobium sp. SG919]NMN87033.1 hypothetical protein [Novosphingobium sp. SG916]